MLNKISKFCLIAQILEQGQIGKSVFRIPWLIQFISGDKAAQTTQPLYNHGSDRLNHPAEPEEFYLF